MEPPHEQRKQPGRRRQCIVSARLPPRAACSCHNSNVWHRVRGVPGVWPVGAHTCEAVPGTCLPLGHAWCPRGCKACGSALVAAEACGVAWFPSHAGARPPAERSGTVVTVHCAHTDEQARGAELLLAVRRTSLQPKFHTCVNVQHRGACPSSCANTSCPCSSAAPAASPVPPASAEKGTLHHAHAACQWRACPVPQRFVFHRLGTPSLQNCLPACTTLSVVVVHGAGVLHAAAVARAYTRSHAVRHMATAAVYRKLRCEPKVCRGCHGHWSAARVHLWGCEYAALIRAPGMRHNKTALVTAVMRKITSVDVDVDVMIIIIIKQITRILIMHMLLLH